MIYPSTLMHPYIPVVGGASTPGVGEPAATSGHDDARVQSFAALYDAHAKFVWRAVLRLGAAPAAVEDLVQEVFLVVHRRIGEFRGHSSARTWLYGIAIRVVRNHRRTLMRQRLTPTARDASVDLAELPAPSERTPELMLAKARATELLQRLLDELEEEPREIFVLVELEELTMPEIVEILGLNLNTAYSRLRAARRAFELLVSRARARDEWRAR
jgi:RNA polymerase sigma-70 factor, ECF subfamily